MAEPSIPQSDTRARSVEASQARPFLDRYRDFLLLLTGSLLGLLGTGMGLLQQTTLQSRQAQVARTERLQREATVVFDDVSRLINAVRHHQERLWQTLDRDSDVAEIDTALARLGRASEDWRIQLPRNRALVSTYFGSVGDDFFNVHDSLLTGFLDPLREIDGTPRGRRVAELRERFGIDSVADPRPRRNGDDPRFAKLYGLLGEISF